MRNLLILVTLFLMSLNVKANTVESDVDKLIINEILSENFEYPHYEIGSEYLSGKKLPFDLAKALFWLAQSSEIEKYSKSDFLLAEIYAKGLVDSKIKDTKKAMFFYERAATRNNPEAKIKLAVNFLYNDEVLNKENGLFWLNESMKDGNLTAMQLYSSLILTKEDSLTVLKQLDLVLSRSDKGDHLSSFYLGLIFLKDNIVKRDLDKSKLYFLRSMNQGNVIAEEFIIQIDKINNTFEK